MRLESVLVVGVILLATATGTAAAMDNTAPFAEAGLDQTVPPNTTVYLDANGSSDPDGSVAAVEWTVRDPDGRTHSPDCVDCRRTHFEATTVGRYTVTLTVTDDDGATSSDRLHVTVASDAGPAVTLSGPPTTTPNSDTTMTADVSNDEAGLQSLAWVVNGSVVAQRDIGGDSASESMTHSFDDTGPKSVSAVVYDSLGNRGTASHTVVVAPAVGASAEDSKGVGGSGDGGGGSRSNGGSSSGGSGGDLCHDPSGLCGNGADKIITQDGVTTVIDSNGQPGIQLATGGNGLADYGRNLHEFDATSTGLNSDDSLKVEAGKLDELTTPEYRTGDLQSDKTSEKTGGNSDDGVGSNNGGTGDARGTSSSSASDNSGGNVDSSGDLASAISGGSDDGGDDESGVGSSGDLANAISDSSDNGRSSSDDHPSSSSDDSNSDSSDDGFFGGHFGGGDSSSSDDGGDDNSDSGSDGGGLFGGLF